MSSQKEVRWELYEQCVYWARAVLFDEDEARNVALQTLEEVGNRELTEKQIKHRVIWRARNALPRIGKRRGTLGGDALAMQEAEASDEPTPEEIFTAKRTREQLCAALGEEAVEFLERSSEYSDREIARATGEPEANLRKRRSRLRRKAKEVL